MEHNTDICCGPSHSREGYQLLFQAQAWHQWTLAAPIGLSMVAADTGSHSRPKCSYSRHWQPVQAQEWWWVPAASVAWWKRIPVSGGAWSLARLGIGGGDMGLLPLQVSQPLP